MSVEVKPCPSCGREPVDCLEDFARGLAVYECACGEQYAARVTEIANK